MMYILRTVIHVLDWVQYQISEPATPLGRTASLTYYRSPRRGAFARMLNASKEG